MLGIPDLIEGFKADLRNAALSEVQIMQKYFLCDAAYVYHGRDDLHQELKKTIADHFSVRVNDIIMVGSGRLGFSIAPDKLWKEFDPESDIDIAVISDELFDIYWKDLYDFNIYLTSRSTRDEAKYRSFLDSFFKGWFRPDLFPFAYKKGSEWYKFFKEISYEELSVNRKVTCGIFKEFYFFENYHAVNIRNLRRGI